MSSKLITRIFLALLVVAAATIGIIAFRDQLTIESLVKKEEALELYKQDNPAQFAVGFFVIYVLSTALSIPGATILTLVGGRFFGFGLGLLIISFASTLGATLAFLVSRFVIGDSIREKYGDKLTDINLKLEKEGPFFLFSMRLIPAIPFVLINLLMGLTPITVRTYWWVSQIGMLAGTIVYVYAGSQIPTLQKLSDDGVGSVLSPGLIIAFIVLAIFPFAVRIIMSKFRPSDKALRAF